MRFRRAYRDGRALYFYFLKFSSLALVLGLSLPVLAADTDNDGLDDDWENTYFEDTSYDGDDDPDFDGLDNEAEETAGSDPTKIDTDGDLLSDAAPGFVSCRRIDI